jgi:hypothetical protein
MGLLNAKSEGKITSVMGNTIHFKLNPRKALEVIISVRILSGGR